MILHPGQRDDAALRLILAEDFSFDGLDPSGSEVVYTDSALTVERMAAQSAASPRRGVAEIEAAIGNIGTLLADTADPRFEVKVFRVQQESDSFTTQQYVAISGVTETGVIEQHATWRTRWTKSAGDSPPRLVKLEVSDVEQVTSRTGGRTLFSHCPHSVLGSTPSYPPQLGPASFMARL